MEISTVVSRLKSWAEGREQGPVKVDVFPTQKCNLDCRFCEFPNVDPEEYEKELPSKKILDIVEEAGEMDAETFGIVGGEPFLKGRILDIMERVKEEGMSGSVTTNGTLLDKSSVNRIVDMKWDLLRVSIDGIEGTHDELRGQRGCFNNIVESLELFEKKGGSHPTIEINTVLNRKNYEKVPEIVELARNYDIERLILLPMIEFNEKASDLKLKRGDKKEVERNLRQADNLAKKYGIETNVEEVLKENFFNRSNETDTMIRDETIPCFVPWYSININPKGIATPCSQFEEEMGVDVRGKNLQEVWLSDEFKKIRNMIANKNLPDTCSKCCAPLLEENQKIRERIKNSQKLASRYDEI